MSKISLKSILKKTFKKSKATKSKKKAKTKKIVKLKKVKKKINKLPKKLIKTKKIPLKKSIKSEVKTIEQKSDGLRITKNNKFYKYYFVSKHTKSYFYWKIQAKSINKD